MKAPTITLTWGPTLPARLVGTQALNAFADDGLFHEKLVERAEDGAHTELAALGYIVKRGQTPAFDGDVYVQYDPEAAAAYLAQPPLVVSYVGDDAYVHPEGTEYQAGRWVSGLALLRADGLIS